MSGRTIGAQAEPNGGQIRGDPKGSFRHGRDQFFAAQKSNLSLLEIFGIWQSNLARRAGSKDSAMAALLISQREELTDWLPIVRYVSSLFQEFSGANRGLNPGVLLL